jgi:UDPglucose 6-dehydrogenase
MIMTEWNEFRSPDFNKIKSLLKAPVIFDGRNIYQTKAMNELGFHYESIGRNKVLMSVEC